MVRRVLAMLVVSAVLPASAQGVRPLAMTPGGEMAARVDGEKCADRVRLTFLAKSAESYKTSDPTAGRLMNNVTQLLRQQCPILARVNVRGVAQEKLAYSGLAEAATGWGVVELGTTGSGLLAGRDSSARTGPAARDLFSRGANFLPFARFVDFTKTAPLLCIRPDASGATCAGVNEYSVQGDGSVRIISSYLLDNTGTTAVLTYPSRNKAGFFCANPSEAQVSVSGGKATAAGRADMQEMLLERVRAAGAEICLGHIGDGPQNLSTESFDADGHSLGQRSTSKLVAQRPALRLDK